MKVKQITLASVFIFLLSAVSVYAQDNWDFGVKGGIALNMMPHTTLDVKDEYKANFGFQGGAFVNVALSDMILAQVEVLYSRKGVTTTNHFGEDVFGGSALTYTRNIHYLQFPVLVGFHSLLDNKLSLLLGPELGVYLGDRIKTNYDSPSYNTNKCNPFNLGLGLQAAYYITDNLGIELKFDLGLTHTFKKQPEGSVIPDDKGRNSAVQMNICYRFGY